MSAGAGASDSAVNGWGDSSGYHLEVSSAPTYAWHEIALLHPDAIDDRSWTGYQCLTGDGRYAAVALMPVSATNTPSLREHGAFAYTVEVATGTVHPVASGVALEYFSPSCGIGDTAVFSVSPNDYASSTDLLTVSSATGAVTDETTVPGQLTSAVLTTRGDLVGVEGSSLVRVAGHGPAGKVERLVALPGSGYDLQPAADGGVDLLTAGPAGRADAWHESGATLTKVATGSLAGMALLHGRAGTNVLTGASVSSGGAHGLRVVDDRGLAGQASFASLEGGAVFSYAGSKDGHQPTAAMTATSQVTAPSISAASAKATVTVPSFLPAGVADPVKQVPTPGAIPLAAPAGSSAASGGAHGGAAQAGTARLDAYVTTAQTPVCSVARLNPSMQVPQPNAAQVDWATQMDEQGLLTGTAYQRPANFDNMGLVAYDPSSDFAPIALDHPSGDSWNTVPRSVMEAILAQESNWDQASFHALPGISGDPLVADYYGAQGTITSINYSKSDCGYGIAQVTNGMRTGDTTYSVHGQMKIANDYEENIAAGLQILESTWNQLYTSGITANGGDPRYLENWYFAAWGYNTGIEPTAAFGNTTGCTPSPTCTGPDGTWGLGFANNPANPAYPPNRQPFLETTYGDAAHPGNWPYQEKIMGWMGSPLLFGGTPDYAPATFNGGSTWLQIPAYQTFCTTSGNDCTPGAAGQSGTCTLADSECWWHNPVTWITSCPTTCATSSYSIGAGSTAPSVSDPHPPTCTANSTDLPTTSTGPPIIVIDDPENSSGVPLNVVGCTSPIAVGGSFSIAYGTNANGDPIGAIDTHQLGAGFGGHILFTHSEDGSNTNLINTGTWTPTLPSTQYYTVKVHVPATGAAATDVVYNINPGGSLTPFKIRLNQHQGREAWLTLGTFALEAGATVTLSNRSGMTPGTYDIAFDAVAFLPEGGNPGVPIGGPPTVSDAPAGSNPSWVNCPCTFANSGDPVNTGTGAYSDTWTDLSTPGRGLPLDFTRTYSSAVADPAGPNGAVAVNGPFGYGWTYSYNLSAATNSSTGAVTITQEDGSKVVFNDASGTYSPAEPRNNATLATSGSNYVFTRRGRQIFYFATTTGRLVAETDLAGANASPPYQTSLAYNSSGQLSTITDPAGRTYTLTWSGGHIVELLDSAGREVTYGYDSAGDLTDVYGVGTTRTPTLADNDHMVYAYASTTNHLLSSVRQPDFYGSAITPTPVTSMTYDSSDRVSSQTNPDGNTTTFNYGPSTTPSLQAGQTLVTDPAGHETLFTYSEGLLSSQTDGYGTSVAGTWQYFYDPVTLGRTVTIDPAGDTTTASYDTNGNLLSSSDANGYATSYTYNSQSQVTSMTDPTGVQTSYSYDQAGHVQTASGANSGAYIWGELTSETVTPQGQSAESTGGTTAAARATSFYYDNAAFPADLTRALNPDGGTTTKSYDSFGDLVSLTDPVGDKTLFGYDTQRGWLTSTVSPAGTAAGTAVTCTPPATGCYTYGHDAYGNVNATADPLGHTTTAIWDADGNKTSSTDADGNTTGYTFDPAGQLTVTTRADSSTVKTRYNPDGTVAATIDAAGNTTSYGYDARARQQTVTDSDHHTTTNAYDPASRLQTVTTPDGKTTTYSHDPAGHVTSVSYSDGVTANVTAVTYDPEGRRVSMTDGTGTSTWQYDPFGELIKTTDGAGQSVSYGYNPDGKATTITYPNGKVVTDTYNSADQMTAAKDWLGQTTSFTYSADGLPHVVNYPNSTTLTTGYNAADQQTGTTLTAGTTTLGTATYGRDNAGQLGSSAYTGSLSGAGLGYRYSPLQQLSTATPSGTGTTYYYDRANNPTGLAGTAQRFDPAGELTTTAATVTGPVTTYGYDPNGERTSQSGPAPRAFAYNQAGNLVSATTATPTVTTTSLPDATIGHAVSDQLTAGGGFGALTFAATGLPTWLSLSPSGQLRGTAPTTATQATISVTVTDQAGTTSPAVPLTITVADTYLFVDLNGSSGSNQVADYQENADGTTTLIGTYSTGHPGSTSSFVASERSTVARSTNFLYVLNLGDQTVTVFSVSPTTGQLTLVATSPSLGASAIAVNPAGSVLYAGGSTNEGGQNQLASYAINSNGTIATTPTSTVSADVDGLAISPDGTEVAAAYPGTSSFTPGVYLWAADSQGHLTAQSITADTCATDVAFISNTTLAAAACSQGTISFYHLAAGQLTLSASTPANALPSSSQALTVGPDGATYFDTSGGLQGATLSSPLPPQSVTLGPTAASPCGTISSISATADGTQLYVACFGTNTIFDYTVAVAGVSHTLTLAQQIPTTAGLLTLNTYTPNSAPTVSKAPNAGPTVTYAYTGDGLRQSKTSNGTTTLFAWGQTPGGNSAVLADQTNSYLYGPTGLPFEQISGSTPSYFVADSNSDTIALIGSGGSVTANYTYGPYGTVTGHTGSASTPLLYGAGYTDSDTGLVYLVNRYYDPQTAQFLSVDPLVGSTRQPYQYVGDNPVNAADPTGLCVRGDGVNCSGQALPNYSPPSCPYSSGGGFGLGDAANLATGIEGAGFSSVSSYFNAAGKLQHLDQAGYYSNALKAVQASNAARGLAVAGAGVAIYNDVTSGKSVGQTAGDVIGGAAGGFVGGAVGSAICGGPATGVGVFCGFVGGSVGGYVGGIVGSDVGGYAETGVKDFINLF